MFYYLYKRTKRVCNLVEEFHWIKSPNNIPVPRSRHELFSYCHFKSRSESPHSTLQNYDESISLSLVKNMISLMSGCIHQLRMNGWLLWGMTWSWRQQQTKPRNWFISLWSQTLRQQVVLKVKHIIYRSIDKNKARLVAKCYTRRERIDYEEIFHQLEIQFYSSSTSNNGSFEFIVIPDGC